MRTEYCQSGAHDWVCRQIGGDFGEGITDTPLTKEGASLIKEDPERAQEVCPGGVIFCQSCEQPFIPGQKIDPPFINLKDIHSKLIEK